MKLPNWERAYIPAAKLTGYLLEETHLKGGSKAKFFRAAGFDETNVEVLEQGLIAIAEVGEALQADTTPHGIKYVVDGELHTPLGGLVQLRTVWIIEPEQDRPRFVTAYPLRRSRQGL